VETEKWYEPMYGRDDRFPDGESMNDVAKRGSEVIDKFIVPHVLNAKGKTAEGTHIVFVSHGICIAETIGALMRKSTHPDANVSSWLGLMNTAWTRCIIGVQVSTS
jgi:broad specificity phosphatase PhoE